MGKKTLILLFFLSIFVAVALYWNFIPSGDEEIDFQRDGYFGRGEKTMDDTKVYPFEVKWPDQVLDDLKSRLKGARIGHEQLQDVPNFEYGFNLATLQKWRHYWLNEYNWRKNEAILNGFPHFITELEGLKIHFIHSKPPPGKYTKVIPLLIVHGWPGSVYEFYKLIPMLVDPEKQGIKSHVAFEVVVPSIPGYGWSEQPHKKGFNQCATARIFAKLMTKRLGHRRYIAQGGDWGAVVVSCLAQLAPNNLHGIHLNMLPVAYERSTTMFRAVLGHFFPRIAFSQPESANYSLTKLFWTIVKEAGYMHIQATKPDTVGVGLNDSPIGLMAYVLEKFSTWTDPDFIALEDGGLEKRFTKDELLTNVMIYWTNGNILSSQRYYKEYFADPRNMKTINKYTSVPTAYAVFPNELADRVPIELARTSYNITQMTSFTSGGHFAAFERPLNVASDIFKFAISLKV